MAGTIETSILEAALLGLQYEKEKVENRNGGDPQATWWSRVHGCCHHKWNEDAPPHVGSCEETHSGCTAEALGCTPQGEGWCR
jgi:hypothetical protein